LDIPPDAKPGTIIMVRNPVPEYLGSTSVILNEFPTAHVIGMEVPGHLEHSLFRTPNGAADVDFDAVQGEPLVLEVHSQRLGRPTDLSLVILDRNYKIVPRAVLRCTAMTNVAFRDHDSRQGNIRLVAWNELAMNDYLYVGTELMRIKELPGHPDADANFVTSGGQRTAYLGTTATHHFTNQPMYKVEVHPPGSVFPPNGLPVFNLSYRNDDGGPGFGRDPRLRFDPPATGRYTVRIRDNRGDASDRHQFRLTVRPPRPDFAITMTPKDPVLHAGAGLPITVTATRFDEFDGPIRIAF
jgi:hypothetical protein